MDRNKLIDLCNALTHGEVQELDITKPMNKQEQLLYALFNLDMEAVLTSKNSYEYNGKVKGKKCPKEVLDNNPFYIQKWNIPQKYEVSIGEQTVLLPKLEEVFQKNKGSFKLKGKVYMVQKCIGYLCDSILFNYKDTPFTDGMGVLGEIANNKEAQGVLGYVNKGDLKYLEVLGSMLKNKVQGKLEGITIGDIRKGRFISYREEDVPTGQNIVDLMLGLPSSLQDKKDFKAWVDNALSMAGVGKSADASGAESEEVVGRSPENVPMWTEPEEVETPSVEKPTPSVKETTPVSSEEKTIPSFMLDTLQEEKEDVGAQQKVHGEQEKKVAEAEPEVEKQKNNIDVQAMIDYCKGLGVDYDSVKSGLESLGYDETERFARALPMYIMKVYKKYDMDNMKSYAKKLMGAYGDCECKM